MLDPYNRKGRILTAALDCAAKKGWAEVGLLDIAEGANLPLSELRGEFATKTDIIAALLRAVDDEVLKRAAKRGEGQEKRDVLFDIDWQGTQQLKEKAREDVVSVFILPPTRVELERRLHSRAQDAAEIVAQRMAKANDELSHWAEYDYVVVNRDIGTSLTNLKAILTAERLKRERLVGMSGFVKALREGR